MKNTSLGLFLVAVTIAFAAVCNPAFSDNTPAAQPDKGQVVFYRPSRAKGAAIRYQINDSAKGSIGPCQTEQ